MQSCTAENTLVTTNSESSSESVKCFLNPLAGLSIKWNKCTFNIYPFTSFLITNVIASPTKNEMNEGLWYEFSGNNIGVYSISKDPRESPKSHRLSKVKVVIKYKKTGIHLEIDGTTISNIYNVAFSIFLDIQALVSLLELKNDIFEQKLNQYGNA